MSRGVDVLGKMGERGGVSNLFYVGESSIRLVVQLLRRLGDPDAVAHNALVAPVFAARNHDAAYTDVRRAVLESVADLERSMRSGTQDAVHRRRQHEIIVRYEMNGLSMSEVLSSLCIEKSQFYRERSAALSYISRSVRRWVKQQGAVQAVGLAIEEQYRIASALQRAGNAALAERVFQELLSTQATAPEKVISLLRLAELNIDLGEPSRADMYLDSATSMSGTVEQNYADVLACECEIVRAQLAWSCGRTANAQEALSHIIPSAQTLLGRNFERARFVLGKALAMAATLEYHVGTMERCQTFVSMGCELLGKTDEHTADLLAELLTIQTSIHTARVPTLGKALHVDRSLLELARTYGLVRKLAVGIKDLAVINHYRGNLPVAQLYGNEALALSTAVCGMKDRAVATFQWAHIRAEREKGRHLDEVFDSVMAIRAKLPPRGYWWGYSYAIESYLLLAQSRVPEALNAAAQALSTFSAVRSTRGVGIAKSLHASALHKLGDLNQARRYAQEAVHLLESSPQSCWLSHAQKQLAIA